MRFLPLIVSYTIRADCTSFAIGPTASTCNEIGITPSLGTLPGLGLNPTTPANEAGETIECPVCVPSVKAARPSEVEMAEPPLEPDTSPCAWKGLRIRPPKEDQPHGTIPFAWANLQQKARGILASEENVWPRSRLTRLDSSSPTRRLRARVTSARLSRSL